MADVVAINVDFKMYIDFLNSIKHETDSINAFNERLCSDISKDEDCLCFPDCNAAARLPHRLVFLADVVIYC